MNCSRCQGNGETDCPTCHGSRNDVLEESCQNCQGIGVISCFQCSGTGLVD